jgi:cell wall-active antibiotic response 4TMS protein YvqF/uncharacterized protein DUF2154
MNATTMKPTTTRRWPLMVVAVVVVVAAGLWFSRAWRPTNVPLVHETVSQPLGAAARANVEIALNIGQLRIGALSQPSELIAGDIAYQEQNGLAREFAVSGDTATFALREQDGRRSSPNIRIDEPIVWDLRLNQATPIRLAIETGVGEGTLDLSQLHITELDLRTGVGTTRLTLPRQGHVRAQLSGGIGETTITIPAGVAVRLESSAGLGNVTLPNSYQQQGNAYVSPDFDTAANRIELIVSNGIGNITIQQSSE